MDVFFLSVDFKYHIVNMLLFPIKCIFPITRYNIPNGGIRESFQINGRLVAWFSVGTLNNNTYYALSWRV